jgi:hypothetical protein
MAEDKLLLALRGYWPQLILRILFRLRLVNEKKIFGCHIGCIEKMLEGVFEY